MPTSVTPDLLCAQHGTGCWRHRHDLSMGGSSHSCTHLFTHRSLPTYQWAGTALGANDTSVNEQIRPNLPSWSGGKTISTVVQLCPTLCNPMGCSTPGFPVHHQLPELAQTHVHRVGDANQPSYPLSSPSPPAFNPSYHQGLFQ